MSYYDYQESIRISRTNSPFYAFIMAAMRQADSNNIIKLRSAWPDVWEELQQRYFAPAGLLVGESTICPSCEGLSSDTSPCSTCNSTGIFTRKD